MSKREIGAANRAACLQFIAKAGYASIRQLALAIWGEVNNSNKVMAGRAVLWLERKKLVVTRREDETVMSEKLVALSEEGARFLTAETGEKVKHGRDVLRHAHSHRTASNWVLAATYRRSNFPKSWSEYEIQREVAPNVADSFSTATGKERKLADTLLLREDNQLVWVEVENTRRSSEDLEKLCRFIQSKFDKDRAERVAEVWIIVSSASAKRIKDRVTGAYKGGWWQDAMKRVWFAELDWKTGTFTTL